VATSISRQLLAGRKLEDIILDRARGYTCSVLDPITAGRHCAIGGGRTDFYVTSTLASQSTPAVGRALAIPLSGRLPNSKAVFPSSAVSYVTLGDGSIHNGHFLSALNLAKYSQNRNIKCPVVFGISDNNICISLPGHQWMPTFIRDCGLQSFTADGCSIEDVYWKSKQAVDYSRNTSRPSIVVFQNLPRRFGHAATDRQLAYRNQREIDEEMVRDPLLAACTLAVHRNIFTNEELYEKVSAIETLVEDAFVSASKESKSTLRNDHIESVSVPLRNKTSIIRYNLYVYSYIEDDILLRVNISFISPAEKAHMGRRRVRQIAKKPCGNI
jgi:TPP-dependent pyruvate/acetoin dehydrogenase alpha subunit